MGDQPIVTQDEAVIQQQLAEKFFAQGMARFEQYDYERAAFHITQAIYILPQRAEFFLARGHAYRMLSKLQDALEDYSSAVRFNPDLAEAYFWRGTLRRELFDLAGAVEDYDRFLLLCGDVRSDQRAQVMQSISDLKNELARR